MKNLQSALGFLSITEEEWNNSQKAFASQPDGPKLIEQIDLQIRDKYEPQTPLTKSKDEYKKIYIEKLQTDLAGEVQLQQKLAGVQNQQQAQQLIITVRT